MIVWGMGAARGSAADPQLWHPPVWTKHLAFALMLPAFILLVAAYVPSRIRDKAKHPMLAAMKFCRRFAHCLANGDLAGLLLFGGFLAWAVYDRISVRSGRQGRSATGTATPRTTSSSWSSESCSISPCSGGAIPAADRASPGLRGPCFPAAI